MGLLLLVGFDSFEWFCFVCLNSIRVHGFDSFAWVCFVLVGFDSLRHEAVGGHDVLPHFDGVPRARNVDEC